MSMKPPSDNTPWYFGFGGYIADGSGIENQSTPADVKFSTGGLYADSTSGVIFHNSTYVENTGSRATVAVFGSAKGNHVFGGNFIGYSDGATDVAVGVEIDFGNLNASAGGEAYGLLLKSLGGNVGGQGGTAHIQMQAATGSPANNGIVFHRSGSVNPVASTGALITVDGGSYAYGLDLGAGSFTSAAIRLPNGGDISIQSTTGSKIGTSSGNKIGFWGATPVARQAVSGSRGGNAALASLLTALATAGIVGDSTSA